MVEQTPGSLLRVDGVSKHYGGVRALQDVRFSCRAGSIHALLGENGAGKSTFIKILSGVVRPDSGRIFLGGEPVSFETPKAAADAGISCIFQELSLLPDLTVADNICIADRRRRFGLIDRAAERRRAEEMLAIIGGEDIHPAAPVGSLPLSRQQMVEIAKALARRPKVLILDEATSALTAADVAKVCALLKRLRAEGMAIIYISHRMHEIAELADECTVFRNGRYIETFAAGTRSDDAIVEMMIGREYSSAFPPLGGTRREGTPALAVRHLSWAGELNDVSLEVHPGEVVGLGGLDGQGQREFLLALFGALIGVGGEIEVAGKPVKITSPRRAKSAELGLALIPEDRKNEGLMLPMTVRENLSFAALDAVSRFGRIDRKAEAALIDALVRQLAIKSDGLDGPVAALSGGNQQKVVIGKWLMTKPRVVLLNDPTRGIDVGTKQEIYQLLRRLAEQGTAILFYSTDYDELIGCCDRVAVFYDGTITRMLEGAELTEHNLIGAALNLTSAARRPASSVAR
ncbi:monosaccharide ABC transporter ATP-binding protein (CUT2 family) [Trinickia symbiotica]|uniref:Sugar ABC transporter ATP-binding protein n=1 Tax=Trinickia symbiotica TaxID=863227 RepID=A0A2N7X8R7_9BURK|nr:sugar ABC transporter ATP-binding protein [Trinickia symbiotica]PMS38143.1 sugar ABC transporter ATP-binding protein [Trinickia symbiotica]PPK47176.1 monosaccharide ABC transporter ATP-binding protein (CUT2 family) [Trinickia symbiotica]